MTRSKKLKIIIRIFSIIGLILFAWAFWLEPSSLIVKEHNVVIEDLPKPLEKLRIAFITDLHVGSAYNGLDNLKKIVKKTNQTKPDIIIIGGDYINGDGKGKNVTIEEMAIELKALSAPLGVWTTLGNHDIWYDSPKIKRIFSEYGIEILDNENIKISRGDKHFWLVGISDYVTNSHDVDTSLKGINDNAPIIGMNHTPDIFPELPDRILLTLAGHTHGGQVYFPVIGRLIVPSDYGEKYAVGHIQEGKKHLFVSTGIGTSILPVRFLVPPEISVINLIGK